MNNKPISRSQSVSITSESTLSLSDLEDSMAGMVSIVLTDSDGKPEIFSDTEDHRWHANTGHHTPLFLHENSMSPSHFCCLSEEILPPPRLVTIAWQLIAPINHHPQHLTICPLHPLVILPPSMLLHHPINPHGLGCGKQHPLLQEASELLRATSKNSMLLQTVELWVYSLSGILFISRLTNSLHIPRMPSLQPSKQLYRWNECWMMDRISHDDESGRMGRGGVKGMGPEVVPTFYYIIVKGKVPHVTSFLDNAIANAGNHPYCEVFIVRDELTALKFLSDKLHDDEILRADF
ncbi:hypothetical protein EDD85DRAFT_955082 [Armillaria nabsnona]|nr:hypothetical protein EDD85DRAFT_955082 [Armillaria nabsnona]